MEDVEIKGNRSFALIPAFGATIILAFFLKDFISNYLEGKNPGFVLSLIFLFFLFLTIISWRMYFDKRPSYILSSEGISFRKNIFSSQPDDFVEWGDIEYFFIETVTGNLDTQEILLKIRNREKHLRIMFADSNIKREDLLKILNEKSIEFNFHYLGAETNRHSSKYK